LAGQTLPAIIRTDPAQQQRQRRYKLNRAYYDGQHDILLSRRNNRNRPAPRNLTALFIDTTVDFVGRPTVDWGDTGPGPQLQDYLQRTLDDNDAELTDYQIELDTAINGDGALKVTWDVLRGRVRFAPVNPTTLFIQVNPADPAEHWLQAQQYPVTPASSPLVLPSGDTLPVTRQGVITEAWTLDTWELWLDDNLLDRVPNPYGILPYIVWPNTPNPGSIWGKGDGEPLKALQDALNDKTDDLDHLIRLASSIIVIEGLSPGEPAIGGADYAVRPGAVWELPEKSRAYLLELLTQSAVGQRLWDINALREIMHQLARVPVAALGDTGRDISGKALEIEIAPLLRVVARKRLTRTAAHRKRAIAIATLAGRFAAAPEHGDLRPTITWTDPLPEDRAAEITNATAILALGASHATALSMSGIADPEAELANRIAEDRRFKP